MRWVDGTVCGFSNEVSDTFLGLQWKERPIAPHRALHLNLGRTYMLTWNYWYMAVSFVCFCFQLTGHYLVNFTFEFCSKVPGRLHSLPLMQTFKVDKECVTRYPSARGGVVVEWLRLLGLRGHVFGKAVPSGTWWTQISKPLKCFSSE